jgi:hypothetical protein
MTSEIIHGFQLRLPQRKIDKTSDLSHVSEEKKKA